MRTKAWARVMWAACALLLCACGDDNGKPSADGGNGSLAWHSTCGDPSCRPEPDGGIAGACTSAQSENGACTTKGESCNIGCGAKRVCADKPFDLTNCPISRRRYKTRIRYLDAAALARAKAALQRLRLAHYELKAQPGKRRLGFIIEDGPPPVTVRADGQHVDLYGFTSLVAAAVKAQAREIAALRQQIAALHAQLAAATAHERRRRRHAAARSAR